MGQTSCIRTVLIVDVSADDILDPGEVGRRSSEHRGLLIHNTSNRTEARYAMNLPRTTGGILTHQRTTWISLSKSQINIRSTHTFLCIKWDVSNKRHHHCWSEWCKTLLIKIYESGLVLPDRQTWAHQAGYNHNRSWRSWLGTTSNPSFCRCHMAQQAGPPG